MGVNEREKIHYELLDALYTARKQVEYLEAALAHNAAFLGDGVEREGQIGAKAPDVARTPNALVRYLDLVEPEEDISDYIGREGHDESRPRLGPDAPEYIKPRQEPKISPLVGQLALGHPADAITFGFPGSAPSTPLPDSDAPAMALSGIATPLTPEIATPPLQGNAPQSPPANPEMPPAKAADHKEPESVLSATVPVDAAARRETEVAPHVNNEKFYCLVKDSPDLKGSFDADGCLLSVSPTVGRYFTAPSTELLGKPLSDSGLSGQAALFEKTVRDVFAAGQPVQREMQLASPLAGEFLADCRFWPEFGVKGDVIAVSVLIHDMTYARRLAQNYYALFNSMDDGFILFEHVSGWEGALPEYGPDDFALVVMNPAFGRMFRLDPPDISGLRLGELMREDAVNWAGCLKRVLTEGRPALQPLRSAVSPGQYEISAYSPETGRVACIVKDVTELRRIEQETRLNESRLAALYRLSHMDAAPEEAVVRYSLEQAVKLTGSFFGYLYVAGENDGKNGRLYWSHEVKARVGAIAPGENTAMPWCGGRSCREIARAEVVNVVKDGFAEAFGKTVAVNKYMIAPVTEDGRIVCLAGVANKKDAYTPSDLRQLELFINGIWFHLRRRWAVQALTKAKEEAEAANRVKDEFLANVSHELRTPLNGVLGMLQVLQQSPLTAEQKECVDIANYSGRGLLRIISDILDFSRIEAGRFELAPQAFDFSATVRSTLGLFIHQAKQENIAFTLTLDKNIPSALIGDEARVRQIIFNLVGNAFKFTRQGEIAVECKLLPQRKAGKRCVYLGVRDTGIGIPEEKIGSMFKPFTQLDGSSTRRYPGAGLGLTIVQRLVRLMDGTLTVESAQGKGTAVHCTLAFDQPEEPVPAPAEVREEPRLLHPLDILVVEDDPVSQFTIRALLKKAGYIPVCVSDGKQAIEALKIRPFACVITDIQMPTMDGMEFTRRIREGNTDDILPGAATLTLLGFNPASPPAVVPIPRDLPIIALTAHAMTGDKERFLGMGVDYYLAKPVTFAELTATLAHIGTLVKSRRES